MRRYSLQRKTLKGLLFVVALFCLGLTALSTDYILANLDEAEFARLQQENQQQRNELQKLVAGLESLQREMTLLSQNDAKVRVMAQLTRANADSETLAGVGGPPEIDGSDSFSEMQRRIDQMRRDIDLRRESQEEIQGFLNDQRSMLSAVPEGWPIKGWLTSSFGMRKSPFSGKKKLHEGYDIAARTGTPVIVTADGVVTRSETTPGYGKLIVIDHGYGYRTYYGHTRRTWFGPAIELNAVRKLPRWAIRAVQPAHMSITRSAVTAFRLIQRNSSKLFKALTICQGLFYLNHYFTGFFGFGYMFELPIANSHS